MYLKQSVLKPGGISPGSAAAKEPNVTIVDVDDILYFPKRDTKGVRMMGDIIMKPNTKMLQVYMTKSKISAPYESDGDEDSINIKQSFEGQHPGNKLEIREFIQNWLGKSVIIIHGSCSEPEREVVGTPCAPLQLKPSKQDNNEGRFHMMKFEAFATSQFLPGYYDGGLTLGAPIVVEDAGDILVNVQGISQYKIPSLDLTEAIKLTLSNLGPDDTITLLGSGGAAPATLANGPGTGGSAAILLRNGIIWVALEGSFITLRGFQGSTFNFIEVARG